MGVDYLNLEYFIERTHDFLVGLHFSVSGIPGWFTGTVHGILIFGMILAFILLILVVYAQIRMVQVEHEGFHALEEEDHEAQLEAQAHHSVAEAAVSTRWDTISALAASTNESDWRRAILEADIMLGDVLAEAGYEGASVGEQLKLTNPLQVKTLRLAWDAHMVRNKVAHGGLDFVLTAQDTKETIDKYKRVFEEFGKI
jgi:hypothetical protein